MKKWFIMVTITVLACTGIVLDQTPASADSSQVAVYNRATTDTTNGPRTMDSDVRTNRVTDTNYDRTYDRDVVDGMRTRAYDYYYRTMATTADNDMDWGWLGIFGLIGLAGLMGRNRNPQGER